MKEVNLKNLKSEGVFDNSNLKKKKAGLNKNSLSAKRKSKSFRRKGKEMILTDVKAQTVANGIKEYLLNNFRISSFHVYEIKTRPFNAELFIGEPIDNDALIMSYFAHYKTEVYISATGINSSDIKSRLVTQMIIDRTNCFLIVFDSFFLETFNDEKRIYSLIEYIYNYIYKTLKTERR